MSVPLTVKGEVDARAVEQLRRCVEAGDALRGVMCADGHVGYSQPIGGAVAYADYISPSGVGFDIGCGNKAVRTDLRHDEIRRVVPRIIDEIFNRISFGIGRKNDEPVDHPVRFRGIVFRSLRRARRGRARCSLGGTPRR